MARTQLFVGLRAGTQRQVFRAARPPKESELRNRFDAVVGPFVTLRGLLLRSARRRQPAPPTRK